jgi:hypothetical protein
MGIEQSHGSLRKIMDDILKDCKKEVDTIYRIYLTGHDTNRRALATALANVARATAERRQSALSEYKRSTRVPGEKGSWATFEDDRVVIDNQLEEDHKNAHSSFDAVEERIEGEFRTKRETILANTKEKVTDAFDAFIEAHP